MLSVKRNTSQNDRFAELNYARMDMHLIPHDILPGTGKPEDAVCVSKVEAVAVLDKEEQAAAVAQRITGTHASAWPDRACETDLSDAHWMRTMMAN